MLPAGIVDQAPGMALCPVPYARCQSSQRIRQTVAALEDSQQSQPCQSWGGSFAIVTATNFPDFVGTFVIHVGFFGVIDTLPLLWLSYAGGVRGPSATAALPAGR